MLDLLNMLNMLDLLNMLNMLDLPIYLLITAAG